MKHHFLLLISLLFFTFGISQNTDKLDSVDYSTHLSEDSINDLEMKLDSVENLNEKTTKPEEEEEEEEEEESKSMFNSFSGILFGIGFGALLVIILDRRKRR